MNYKQHIASKIATLLTGFEAQEIAALMEYPSDPEKGDLSLPCFRLSKPLRKSPQLIADELKFALQDEEIDYSESVAGYLNIFLKKERFAKTLVSEILTTGDRYGSQEIGQGSTVVIDFSSPNIAKPFHVAHLRSTVIGNALYQIHAFLGYKCVGINHLGDWGTQFGRLIVAYQLWGNEEAVTKGAIDELLHLYVKFHEEAEQDPTLEDQARAWFTKMEQGDESALTLWRWFVEISIAEFQKIYKLLGVQFDAFTGESFYNDKMEPIIEELKSKQLLEEDEGAWLVRLDDYGMAPALMLKKDGSSLYHTRDLTAAMYRAETYDFAKAIYVTDYAQNLHFQQWFKVVELMGYEWADKLEHVAFGRVSIEGASLSTRKGNVIKLEDLLQQAIQKTLEIIEARNPDLVDKKQAAEQVGVGAVIFNDLSSNRIKDIDFSWDSALNFEGETGPYVQYTYARTCSVWSKALATYGPLNLANEHDLEWTHLASTEAIEVLKQLYLFIERVEQAMLKLEPSVIARYLIDLAQAFNRFYHACYILLEEKQIREARLALVSCVQTTLRNGLKLIGLQAPDEI
ncbi:arginine--tRNA ligase [Paenibacillus pectinilyticus]|uniref:Arginine--tRNA ligase n=1 Tax=Paenibacillus pectinilyticus TaxID=512399 RepID=A0A1C0ZZC5_9BACL|nr:arginine--tRNA ligase [Paenibacillus pectinilyticus]OCT13460.1 arginine--tRNA ligase [Paenibacillus pectinilyticus]